MTGNQEAGETPQGETTELTDDPSTNQVIAFLETTVEEKIGVASDGRL